MNTPPVIDWVALRDQFPSLAQPVRNGKSLIYLDAAAAAQKPWAVIDAERGFYERTNAAVHRGAHYLAEQATVAFESARADVAAFIGADVAEVVWTSSATAALNTVAYAFGNASLGRGGASSAPFALRPGDEIVVTEAEHHANLIPWQELCARTGAVLRWLGLTDAGRLDLSNLDQIITERTRILAFGMYLLGLVLGSVALPLLVIGPDLLVSVLPGLAGVIHAMYWPVMLTVLAAFLNTLYHLAVPVRTPWSQDLPGTVLALLLWLGGSALLRDYVSSTFSGTNATNSLYGGLAAAVAILVWLYVTALATLLGAALNAAVEQVWPSRRLWLARLALRQRVAAQRDASHRSPEGFPTDE